MVLASLFEKALRCPDCNTYYEEWDPKQGGHIHAYYPKTNVCLGCKAKQSAYSALTDDAKDHPERTFGVQVRLERNPEAPGIKSPQTQRPIRTN